MVYSKQIVLSDEGHSCPECDVKENVSRKGGEYTGKDCKDLILPEHSPDKLEPVMTDRLPRVKENSCIHFRCITLRTNFLKFFNAKPLKGQ
jgi:hypothetical protein